MDVTRKFLGWNAHPIILVGSILTIAVFSMYHAFEYERHRPLSNPCEELTGGNKGGKTMVAVQVPFTRHGKTQPEVMNMALGPEGAYVWMADDHRNAGEKEEDDSVYLENKKALKYMQAFVSNIPRGTGDGNGYATGPSPSPWASSLKPGASPVVPDDKPGGKDVSGVSTAWDGSDWGKFASEEAGIEYNYGMLGNLLTHGEFGRVYTPVDRCTIITWDEMDHAQTGYGPDTPTTEAMPEEGAACIHKEGNTGYNKRCPDGTVAIAGSLTFETPGVWNKRSLAAETAFRARGSTYNADYNPATTNAECVKELQHVFQPKGIRLSAQSVGVYYALYALVFIVFSIANYLNVRPSKTIWNGPNIDDDDRGIGYIIGILVLLGIFAFYCIMAGVWGTSLEKAGFGQTKTQFGAGEEQSLPSADLPWAGPKDARCGMHLLFPADIGHAGQSLWSQVPMQVSLLKAAPDTDAFNKLALTNDETSADAAFKGFQPCTTTSDSPKCAEATDFTWNTIFDTKTANVLSVSNAMAATFKNAAGEFDSGPADRFVPSDPDLTLVWTSGNVGNTKEENDRVYKYGLSHICTADEMEMRGEFECANVVGSADYTQNQSIHFFTHGPFKTFMYMLLVHGLMVFIFPFIAALANIGGGNTRYASGAPVNTQFW
tara:strand:- start:672 stop:2648 length:1977 start_codon:yes stop_codon:yes gene_type:complete